MGQGAFFKKKNECSSCFFSHVINVPEEALEGGMTAESVERKLSIEDKSQWRQR